MRRNSFIVIVFLLIAIAYSETPITLSGTVLDNASQPVAGANVMLKNRPELSAVTDQAGGFIISTVAVRAPYNSGSAISNGALLKGSDLYISQTTEGTIKLELFNALGRKLGTHAITKLGSMTENVLLPFSADGLYVLRVSVNNTVSIFKQYFSEKQMLAVSRRELHGTRREAHTVAATAASGTDALVVVATGYAPEYFSITGYTASDLQIALSTPTTQWQPNGVLEHVGNMVKIKAKGTSFAMGQPVVVADDDGPWSFEQPVHTVSFTYDYLMDTTEITQKMFKEIMADVPGYASPEGWNITYGIGDTIAAHHAGIGDAILFCNARSKKESLDTVYTFDSISGDPGRLCNLYNVSVDCSKKGYRLPTEPEWEYACRGGTVTDFYWNKMYRPYPATAADTAEISTYALWFVNAGNKITDGPEYGLKQGVASKLPNNYGLYDMVGACMEWYHIVYWQYEGALTDPKPSGALTLKGETSVIQPRGGNFDNRAINLRSASRKPIVGNYPYCYWGFRTVKEVLQ